MTLLVRIGFSRFLKPPVTTVLIMCIGMWLPYSPLAATLGFTHLPPLYWPILFLTLLCYVILTQLVKMWLMRRLKGIFFVRIT